VQQINEQGQILATYAVGGSPVALPPVVVAALLQIVRDALAAATKRPDATQAHVGLVYGMAGVTLTVTDNGLGFDPDIAQGAAQQVVQALQAHAATIGATLSVSSRPEGGTTVRASVPASGFTL
jgi:nitrate/nitrite-specific signal transduction histidine kinase